MADWFREALVKRDGRGRFSKKAGTLPANAPRDLIDDVAAVGNGTADMDTVKRVADSRWAKDYPNSGGAKLANAILSGEKPLGSKLPSGSTKDMDKSDPLPSVDWDALNAPPKDPEPEPEELPDGVEEDGTLTKDALYFPEDFTDAIRYFNEKEGKTVKEVIKATQEMYPDQPNRWTGDFKAFDAAEEPNALAAFDPSTGGVIMSTMAYTMPEALREDVLIHESFHVHSKVSDPWDYMDNVGYEEGLAEALNRMHRKEVWAKLHGKQKASEYERKVRKELDPGTPYTKYVDALEKARESSKMSKESFYGALYSTDLKDRADKMWELGLMPYAGDETSTEYSRALMQLGDAHRVLTNDVRFGRG